MQAYIYVLHFDTPLSHAQHYVGCTCHLTHRLAAHANGGGSNLCRVLMEQGIHWELAGLATTSKLNMRRLERSLKNQHNASRYCTKCTPLPFRLPGTTPYPLEALHKAGLLLRSDQLVTTLRPAPPTIRLTTETEDAKTILRIKHLMALDKDALGFIPAGGDEGLAKTMLQGKIAIAENDQELIGYAAHTFTDTMLTIHQCVVQDEYRLCGVGRQLVTLLRDVHPARHLKAKVRNDLAANEFWKAIGFIQIDQSQHPTSQNLINTFILHGDI